MPQPVTIIGSELRLMQSKHSGRTYQITISLPLGYNRAVDEEWPFNDTPERWPVVYMLDGNWYAGMVTGIIRPMAWCGSTTDAIVVGIGYPESGNPIADTRDSFTRRDHDLTPIHDPSVEESMTKFHKRPVPNGDAAGFLKFLQDELIPIIESDYRTDPSKRILVGHSYGGLFGLYAMFEASTLFSTLVLGSPTLSYGSRLTFEQEAAFAKTNHQLPAKVYLFVGEHEEAADDTTVTDTLRMAAILQSRKYEGFLLVKQVFLDQNHCEVAAPGIQWGLKHALKR